MKHFAAFPVLVLLAACTLQQRAARDADTTQALAALDTLPNGSVCQIAPDGGPDVADLAPADPNAANARPPSKPVVADPRRFETTQTIRADRGIGGTGAPQGSADVAERGIGGTGIVGVITGFASICVNGLEVAYDNSAAVDIDGSAGTPASLRVGQIVVLAAKGSADAPTAQSISVRRQVVGRIESVEPGTGTLTIAGQAVSVPAGTPGSGTPRIGDWVAASGLRRDDGLLIATRLDRAPAGNVTVRGQVIREGDAARIGQLVLNEAAADLKAGQFVLVSGQYKAGQLQLRSVVPDPLPSNPGSYFGANVNHLVLQGYVRVADGAVYLNGLKVAAGPGVSGKPGADRAAVVSLERKSDGSFTAVGLRYTAMPNAGATHAPYSASRSPTTPLPQLSRSETAIASLAGNNAGSSSASQPAVATAPLLVAIPSASTSGITAVTSAPATTPEKSIVTPLVTTTAPLPPTAMPTITQPATTPATAPAITTPPETGGEVPAPPATSQLMSSTKTPASAVTPASQAPHLTRTASAHHPGITGSGISTSTVSLATQAETTPATPAASPTVAAPAVSKTGSIKLIVTTPATATGGTPQDIH